MPLVIVFGSQAQAGVVYANASRGRHGTATPTLVPPILPAVSTRHRSGTATPIFYSAPTPPAPPGQTSPSPSPRWTFYDFSDYSTGTFVVNPDPKDAGDFAYAKAEKVAYNWHGNPFLVYTQDHNLTGTFSGTIFSQADFAFFDSWFSRDGEIVLTDDLGRRCNILFESYEAQRVRKASDDWFHTYKVTYLITHVDDI